MNIDPKSASFRILMLIADPKLARRASELLRQGNVPLQYQQNARGTASSELVSLLGLGSPDKTILVSILPKALADRVMTKLHRELRLGETNTGIAFTLPLSGGSSHLLRFISRVEDDTKLELKKEALAFMEEMKHVLIAVIANQGYSEEIMAAARSAGATGGTVLHSRRVVDENAAKFWDLNIQEEKETILILSGLEKKLEIMKAISSKCGMHSEAQGLVLSVPVDSVIGL